MGTQRKKSSHGGHVVRTCHMEIPKLCEYA